MAEHWNSADWKKRVRLQKSGRGKEQTSPSGTKYTDDSARIFRQPQDGTDATSPQITSVRPHGVGRFTDEPEDARLTGGTRSLMRRLSALNFGLPSRISKARTDSKVETPVTTMADMPIARDALKTREVPQRRVA